MIWPEVELTRCARIDSDPVDWTKLDEAIEVLRPLIPLVKAVEVQSATATAAVEKVLVIVFVVVPMVSSNRGSNHKVASSSSTCSLKVATCTLGTPSWLL